MGGSQSTKQENAKVLILGLDDDLVRQFKGHLNLVSTEGSKPPTIGYNWDEVHYKKAPLLLMGVSIDKKTQGLWDKLVANASGVIMVVDSTNTKADTAEKLRDSLAYLASHVSTLRVLLVADNQDADGAASPEAVADALGLSASSGFDWHSVGASSATGVGCSDAMDWFMDRVSGKKKWQE